MAKLPQELTETINRLKQKSLEVIDRATEVVESDR
jgi:hypothetical protein